MCGFGQFLSSIFNRRSSNIKPKQIEEDESELEDIEKIVKREKKKESQAKKEKVKKKEKKEKKEKQEKQEKQKESKKVSKKKSEKDSPNYTEPNPNRRKPKLSKNKKGESIIIQDIDNETLLEQKKTAIPNLEDSIFDYNFKHGVSRNKVLNLDEEILLKEDKKQEFTDYSYIIDKYITSRKDQNVQNEQPKKEISLLLKNRMSQYLKTAKITEEMEDENE